jgi:hypothetical protein
MMNQMMKIISQRITASQVPAFIFVMLLLNVASAQSQSPRDDVRLFLQLSGLETQIREIPELILVQFDSEKDNLDVRNHENIRNTVRAVFNPDQLMSDAYAYLIENYDQRRLRAINTWLQDPLTQRMNLLEMSASSDSLDAEREAYFEVFETSLPPQKRVETILAFQEHTDAIYGTVSILSGMYMALIRAMNQYAPRDKRVPPTEFDGIRAGIVQQLMPLYEEITLAINLFTYRDVSDQDLETYMTFFHTEDGKWFSEHSYGVMEHVVRKATANL